MRKFTVVSTASNLTVAGSRQAPDGRQMAVAEMLLVMGWDVALKANEDASGFLLVDLYTDAPFRAIDAAIKGAEPAAPATAPADDAGAIMLAERHADDARAETSAPAVSPEVV